MVVLGLLVLMELGELRRQWEMDLGEAIGRGRTPMT